MNLSMQVDLARRLERSMEILRLYKAGVPVAEICDTFECSRTTVLRLARMAGLPKRPKHFPTRVREDALAMLRAGDLLKDIAHELGVSEAYVSKLAKEAGLNRYKRTGDTEHGVHEQPAGDDPLCR